MAYDPLLIVLVALGLIAALLAIAILATYIMLRIAVGMRSGGGK